MTVDPIGGVWTYALELARAFEPHGIEVGLASMGRRLMREQSQEVGARKNVRLFESACRCEWMDDPWDDVDRAGEWLLQIADRFRPDFIHLNGYSHAVLPWAAPVLVVAHSCVLSWWRAVKNEDAPPQYDRYRARVTAGIRAADLLVAPSMAMRDAVRLHYNVDRDCVVIHNARDARLFAPAKKLPLVFACGRVWDEAKNLQLLNRVAPEIEWQIAVSGDSQHPSGSTVKFENLYYLGKVAAQEMAQQLSRMAVFALPARYEPFGLSALEAALSGCALVLGDIPSLREIWEDSAIFVSADDANALSRALNDLISDSQLRESLGNRARARALQFSAQRMAQRYLEAYRTCIGEAGLAVEAPPAISEKVAA
jgi:glycosyltransferase involved in cell wall biosynthesis